MRKTVCKRLRKQALLLAPATKRTNFITRFWTGKTDAEGKKITFDRTTVVCGGYRRAYQDLKRDYRRRMAS
jgi:hypothetical protein